jgi:hypothetical protein
MGKFRLAHWPRQGAPPGSDEISHSGMAKRLASRQMPSRTSPAVSWGRVWRALVQYAEQPKQNDNGDRDADQPEQNATHRSVSLFVDLRTNGGQNAESKSRFLGMGARRLRLVGALVPIEAKVLTSCFPEMLHLDRGRRACQEHPIKLQVKKIGREGAAQQIGQMFDAVF